MTRARVATALPGAGSAGMSREGERERGERAACREQVAGEEARESEEPQHGAAGWLVKMELGI